MCTRVLWNENKLGVITGRTMDWPESTKPLLTVTPQGHHRHGGKMAGQTVVAANPLEWTSRYGSLATSIYGIGTVDGLNERGFAAHALYLKSTELAERDQTRPGLHMGLWAQYLLDNATTVAEAVSLMDYVQLVMVQAHGFQATLHLVVEDADGDSAVFEHIGGKLVVHHGRQYRLMTNDPTYDEQLRLLAQQDYSHPSMDLPVPGNVSAIDRFQRAAYFSQLLPEPADEREAAASMLAIMRNVSVPFGAPYGEFGVYNTEYRTVCDLANRRYFFELTTAPSVIWTELGRLDFKPAAPVMTLDPYDVTLSGDVTQRYTPAEIAF